MNNKLAVILATLIPVAVFVGGAAYYTALPKATPDLMAQAPVAAPTTSTPTPAPAPAAPESSAQGQLVRPNAPVLGDVNAPVTLVEFFDPSCEACRAFAPHVEEVLAQHPGQLRVVLRYVLFHPSSAEAARVLEVARLQNKFEPVLKAMFEKQDDWASHSSSNLMSILDVAVGAGLDIAQAKADIAKPEIDALLKQDWADMKALNVRQTPTFYLNGHMLEIASPAELKAFVAKAIEIEARNGSAAP